MIPLPKQPKIIQKNDNTTLFEIEGLYPGYGVTIGNSLRRVLLSSLEGAAITQVKIKGVAHEFSVIPGVLEDVVMIILNLKKLRFKIFTDQPQIATLIVKGEKKVKGKDLKLSPQIELVNPEAHIATLTKSSAELNMEIQIEKGLGYEPVERRELKKSEIGVIPIDAFFTPVKKVSFSVENMRVGKRTDFDRLKIEIETDGTISSQEALKQSSEIVLEHFSLFVKGFAEVPGEKEKNKEKEKPKTTAALSKVASSRSKDKEKEDVKKIKIENLNVAEKVRDSLIENKIRTIGGLLKRAEEDITNFEGLGEKGMQEIKKALKKLGVLSKFSS